MIDYRKRAKVASIFLKIMGFILAFVLLIALISLISTKDFKTIPIIIIVALIIVAIFIISNVLKNKPEKLIPALNNTNDNDGKNTLYYKAEWFYNEVYSQYCIKHDVEKVTNESEVKRIWEYAFNKLSVFLTWLIDREFFVFENEEIEEGARKLKAREITANEFFVVDCNMAFSKDEIKKRVINFVNDYFYFGTHKYGSYEEDYNNFIKNTLHKDENEIVFNWDEYEQFKLVLDQAYDNYNKKINEDKLVLDRTYDNNNKKIIEEKRVNLTSNNVTETYNVQFPFFVNVFKTGYDEENGDEPLELKGKEAYDFLNNEDVEMICLDFENSDLYKYFNELSEKIVNMKMKFLENGYINITISVRDRLLDEEKQMLLKDITGQLSDGWGEGDFEFEKDTGETYEIVFWKYEEWNINYV